MKKTLFTFIFITTSSISVAQHQPCSTDENYKKQIEKDPSIELKFQQFQSQVQTKTIARRSAKIIIPVVFHVMHDNGIENISEAQIKDAIAHLNIDYNRQNADTSKTRDLFKSVASNCEIEFRLASKDPKGNCTNGIVRYQTSLTNNADDNIKPLSVWPSDHYYNVWVVKSITSTSSLGTILGYAQFPWTGLYRTDGVIIRHDMVGTIGTAAGNNYLNRTLTHETGHWLGLFHTFQGACSDGDFCDDTPPVKEPSFNICLPSVQNTCDSDMPDLIDQYENYMDYSDGKCQNMFSKDQKNRMLWAINLHRSLLVNQENMDRTGMNNPLSNCAPKAQFYAVTPNICAGNKVQFNDISYQNTSNLNYQWHFENGIPENSTDKNPSILFPHHSHNSVTLIVSNQQGSDTITYENYIHALAPWEDKPTSISESFETGIPKTWHFEGNTTNIWTPTSRSSFIGSTSAMIINGFGKANEVNKLITSQYDISGSNPTLTFQYAFCQRTFDGGQTKTNDKLTFKISLDCGKTWTNKWFKQGASLSTLPNEGMLLPGMDFFPANQISWKSATIDLSSIDAIARRNVLFMWEFISDAGNNLFIDDINLSQTLGRLAINVHQLSINNPVSNNVIQVSSDLFLTPNCQIFITDLLGKTLLNFTPVNNQAQQNWESDLHPGTYIFTIKSNNYSISKKLIIE